MVQRTVRPLRYDRFSNSLLEQEKSMKKPLCILLVLMLILIRERFRRNSHAGWQHYHRRNIRAN